MEWRLTFLCRSNLKKCHFQLVQLAIQWFFFFFFNFKLEMKPPQSVRFHNWLCERKRHCIIHAELISDWGEGFQLHKKFDRYPIFFDCRGYTRVSFSSCQLQTRGGIWFLFYSRCNSYADKSTHTHRLTHCHTEYKRVRGQALLHFLLLPSSHMDTPDDCCLSAYKDTYTRSYQL